MLVVLMNLLEQRMNLTIKRVQYLRSRDQLAAQQPLAINHPAQSVLMMCIGMNDPGLIVFPTHRLFRGLPDLTSRELSDKIGKCFDLVAAGEGPAAARAAWCRRG